LFSRAERCRGGFRTQAFWYRSGGDVVRPAIRRSFDACTREVSGFTRVNRDGQTWDTLARGTSVIMPCRWRSPPGCQARRTPRRALPVLEQRRADPFFGFSKAKSVPDKENKPRKEDGRLPMPQWQLHDLS
jgi:hypothetical protein